MNDFCRRALRLAVCILLCIPVTVSSATQISTHDRSQIARYLKLYGYDLPWEIVKQSHAAFSPLAVDCGPVQVSVDEILYDGQWMYTAASIWPKDPDTTVIMPGSAHPDDPAAGFYGEKARNDKRSFKTAAKEDNKQLLSVYAYIKEFDDIGAYFLDHFQEENSSVLFSGAEVAGGEETVECTWVVQIYAVDLQTKKFTLQNEYFFPITIQPLQPYLEKIYYVGSGKNAPFDHAILVDTPLNTYVFPQWNDIHDQSLYRVTLDDSNGFAVQGAFPGIEARKLKTLSKEVIVTISERKTDGMTSQLTLIAEDLTEAAK